MVIESDLAISSGKTGVDEASIPNPAAIESPITSNRRGRCFSYFMPRPTTRPWLGLMGYGASPYNPRYRVKYTAA
eukprot:scaffold421320_cov58-Attheya_sp.AAC.2